MDRGPRRGLWCLLNSGVAQRRDTAPLRSCNVSVRVPAGRYGEGGVGESCGEGWSEAGLPRVLSGNLLAGAALPSAHSGLRCPGWAGSWDSWNPVSLQPIVGWEPFQRTSVGGIPRLPRLCSEHVMDTRENPDPVCVGFMRVKSSPSWSPHLFFPGLTSFPLFSDF